MGWLRRWVAAQRLVTALTALEARAAERDELAYWARCRSAACPDSDRIGALIRRRERVQA